jgi:hypothetical protein
VTVASRRVGPLELGSGAVPGLTYAFE